MQKKLLLVLDSSMQSNHARKYIMNMTPLFKDISYTLFHVQPSISQFLLDEAKTDMNARAELERVKKKNADAAKKILEDHKAEMISQGIPKERIEIVTQPKKLGITKDILDYAQERLYDAIVAGRRGLTKLQEAFMGSVTSKLLEHSQVIPVWIVDGDVKSQKIMIAVDGSESSLRALDHLSFMLRQNSKVDITMLHVVPKLKDYCVIDFDEVDKGAEDLVTRGAKKCVDNFFAHASKILKQAGIQDDQIHIKEVQRSGNVGKTIIEEAEKGDFGTVVIGRRGLNKAFFIGSISKYVIDKISDRTLWLVT